MDDLVVWSSLSLAWTATSHTLTHRLVRPRPHLLPIGVPSKAGGSGTPRASEKAWSWLALTLDSSKGPRDVEHDQVNGVLREKQCDCIHNGRNAAMAKADDLQRCFHTKSPISEVGFSQYHHADKGTAMSMLDST